ncbi:hypothetical protein D5018_14545 [Parashewanella curva]|uniref:Uncharacterized protein n=1 Tax=Parashewanella curva TaxID=2338552 RepID=A0A3L8PWW9_9GAMM|nr:hypothetical protein D5018_14545 [Parashewanella curva]
MKAIKSLFKRSKKTLKKVVDDHREMRRIRSPEPLKRMLQRCADKSTMFFKNKYQANLCGHSQK